ncbi:DUF2961 domain-containing protein [Pontiella sp. NLcol2]|uniref:DUF2961 domain-containing protein n=1 Tax=Pontiella agarivorans TaxID=3038953 RepID=A0ABU5MT89_9BACT|nr:DUF2961 domain-containing protein [Pontiella agarivorans]
MSSIAAISNAEYRVLDRMTHFEHIPILESDVRTYEFSSFKRIAEAADKNSWLYERNGERVMFHDEGPGCVTRLWVTGVDDQTSRINFYFDGESEASFSVTPYELYESGMFPYPIVAGPNESAGGRVSYVPIPYEKSLMITDVGADAVRYYNITYENYAEGTEVESWTAETSYLQLAEQLAAVGRDPKPVTGNEYLTGSGDLANGHALLLLDTYGSGVVQSVEFDFDAVPAEVLKSCTISMEFDGMKTVDQIPLGEFFGSAVGEVDVLSQPIGMRTNGNWYCYFPMPFWESARIQITNNSDVALSNFVHEVAVNSDGPARETAGYFHARYREAAYSADADDLVLFDESGCSGKFVGLSLYMEGEGNGFRGMLYLEGDARVYVDGAEHPFIHGTGNEDWFNGAYYYNDYSDKGANQAEEIFCMPYHGLPAKYHCHGAESWTQAYRFNISDPINWTSSLLFTIEHGQYPAYEGGYYSCVTYSYQRPGAASFPIAVISAANAYDYFYTCDGVPATNTAKFITPRAEENAPEITLVGYSNVTASAFSVSIPPENEGVILQLVSDFSSSTNTATVSMGDRVVGRWCQLDLNYTNSPFGWGINEVFLPVEVTGNKNRLDLSISYSAPATEYRIKVIPLSNPLEPGALYQEWIQQFSGLRSFTNYTDNPDADAFDNFTEYVFGGNPEGHDQHLDTIGSFRKTAEGLVEFSYPKRIDENLVYSVQICTNLASGSWSIHKPLSTDEGVGEHGFSMVTNQMPGAHLGFFRLLVEER